ncbi:hypothetical protein B296_00027405 [Ensete ventricosum]|uniref:Uncharacterized protein n=1 Tax=Ensete ventricosum TaxID=4639 RepID=A0A426ZLG5_ENSVE|nr:hypothetical protein B296_00027405 [Ensete ventricosum]
MPLATSVSIAVVFASFAMTAHVVSNTTFIAIASTIATAASELVAFPSRYVCRYLLVLISKSDVSIFAFAVQRQLLLHLPRAALVYAPPTTNYFHYIDEASKAKNQTAVGLLSWSECGAMADCMRRQGAEAVKLSCSRMILDARSDRAYVEDDWFKESGTLASADYNQDY